MEENNDKPLTLEESRELNFEFGLDTVAAKELQAALDAATESAGADRLIVIELTDGMVTLGYPAEGGPEDQTIAGKALLIIAGLQADRVDLKDQISRLETELADAIARAEKAETGEKKAKATLTKASAPAKRRKLGAIDDVDGDKIRAAIAGADEVQVAFSDGTREVLGLSPVIVAGDAWKDHPNGLMLNEPVEIEGPGEGTSVTIDGYALMIDGKQVAYSRRSTPLQIAPGQHMKISDDIIF
jgi:hypothetical protein